MKYFASRSSSLKFVWLAVLASGSFLAFVMAKPLTTSFNPPANFGEVKKLLLQPDGKILASGLTVPISGIPDSGTAPIVRYNSDGTLDTSFYDWQWIPSQQGQRLMMVGQAQAAVRLTSGQIVLGGTLQIKNLNPPAQQFPDNRIVRLNSDGTLDFSFDVRLNNLMALSEQPDGKLVIGGAFTGIGGASSAVRNRIARINTDGTVDEAFDPNANSFVRAIALQPDGKILVGGEFSTIGGQNRNYLARLNADGSLDTSFTPNIASGDVRAILVLSSGKIMIGGQFQNIDGQARQNLARLNADGTLDQSFTLNANGAVESLVLQADGKLLVGGTFTSLGGVPRFRLARLNADGSLDTSFFAYFNGFVYATVTESDGRIIAGGEFSNAGGQARNKLARLNADGSIDDCPTTLSAASQAFNYTGGTGSVTVTTDCGWTAAPDNNVYNSSWITITAGASGTGPGAVNFSIPANGGSARTGLLIIAGQVFTVTQGANCENTLSVTPSSLPQGQVGVAYSQQLAQSGGTEPITWSVISGALPPGLTLDSSGLLSGTPTQTGSSSFDVRVQDANTCTGVKGYVLNITCGNTANVANNSGNWSAAATWGCGGTPTATQHVTILSSRNVTLDVDPLAASITVEAGATLTLSGSHLLSSALTVNGTLAVNGILNANGHTVTVTNCSNNAVTGGHATAFIAGNLARCVNSSGTFNFPVGSGGYAPFSLTPTLLSGATTFTVNTTSGRPNGALTAADAVNRTWNLTAGSALTANLSFTYLPADDTGSIGAGNIDRVIRYNGGTSYSSFAAATAGQTLSVTGINAFSAWGVGKNTPPAITAAAAVTRQQGTAASTATIATVSDGESAANSLSVTATSVPAGISVTNILNPDGTITAKVAAGCAATTGNNTVVLTATDNNGASLTANLTINVTANSAPTVSYGNWTIKPSGTLTFSPTQASDNGSITGPNETSGFSVLDDGGLTLAQATISVSPAGKVTISNAPASGTFTPTIRATDNCGANTDAQFTLKIFDCQALAITPADLPGGTVGSPYSRSLTGTTSEPYLFTKSGGTLPTGLSLSTGGVLSGTPQTTGTYNFTIRIEDGNGCVKHQNFALVIGGTDACAQISLPAEIERAFIGQSYSQLLTASPTSSNYNYTSSLSEPGFSFSCANDCSSLTLSNSNVSGPVRNIDFTLTATLTTSANCFSQTSYRLKIRAPLAALALLADYDGDAASDYVVWSATGEWRILSAQNRQPQVFRWGTAGDVPVLGDYDGDGKTDLAVWRPSSGTWYIKQSRNGQPLVKQWGVSTDVPVPGDYDGDHKTDIAVWRPSTGTWYVWRSRDQQAEITSWGAGYAPYDDLPTPGDFDGDGLSERAVFRRGNGTWYIKHSSDGAITVRQWGLGTDVPVAQDYDGDGRTDIAVWRGAEGKWYVRGSRANQSSVTAWGSAAAPYYDLPVAGDYDGDGKADLAVWRAPESTWYVLRSGSNAAQILRLGQPQDKPVSATPRL